MPAGLLEVRQAAAALASVDPRTLAAPALEAAVVELRVAIDGLEGVWSRFVAALDGSGSVEGGTTAWLLSACRLSPAAARTRVTLARRLDDRPETADALSAGEISVDHARLLTTALHELGAVDEGLATEAEASLIAAARQVDPARLRREIAHARHALVPEATADADALAYQRRHLDVATTFEGTVAVHGTLDPESGDILLTALASLSGRTGPDDHRSPGQCRADALVELCHQQLDRGHLPAVGGERPHLTVLVPLPALTGPAGAVDAVRASGTAGPREASAVRTAGPAGPVSATRTASTAGPAGAPRPVTAVSAADTAASVSAAGMVAAEATWGAVLGPESSRRLACDASITRVVLGPDSQPLDVGRRTRLIPPAIRTALTVRDRGCTYPGCDRGPQWTDAHHIRHWADGGPTSLDNLTLLCRQHHRAVHQREAAAPHAPPRAAA
jgi:Domain of unknown function (DUF222)/HNH endonuclease